MTPKHDDGFIMVGMVVAGVGAILGGFMAAWDAGRENGRRKQIKVAQAEGERKL